MTTTEQAVEQMMKDMINLNRELTALKSLTQTQAQLIQANAALTNTSSRISSRLPEKFSGTNRQDSVENFKSRIDLYFLIHPHSFLTAKERVLFVIQQLEGAAFAYMEPFLP